MIDEILVNIMGQATEKLVARGLTNFRLEDAEMYYDIDNGYVSSFFFYWVLSEPIMLHGEETHDLAIWTYIKRNIRPTEKEEVKRKFLESKNV